LGHPDATANGDTATPRFTSMTTGIRGPLLDAISIVDIGGGSGGMLWLWVLLGLLALAVAAVVVWLLLPRRSSSNATPA
jgi:hypothetical protein